MFLERRAKLLPYFNNLKGRAGKMELKVGIKKIVLNLRKKLMLKRDTRSLRKEQGFLGYVVNGSGSKCVKKNVASWYVANHTLQTFLESITFYDMKF